MMKVKQDRNSRRRQIRLRPELDDALERIANRRGCTVSDVIREAAIEHFHLFPDDGQTDVTQVNQYSPSEANG